MVALIILGVLLFILAGGLSCLVTIYNGLVLVKNNALKAWSNIDVLLKQRHDEIPKLSGACEGYMKHEKETLAKVIALRNSAAVAGSVAEKGAKEGALSGRSWPSLQDCISRVCSWFFRTARPGWPCPRQRRAEAGRHHAGA